MEMSAGLVKSETAGACEEFQLRKKNPKITISKSAIITSTPALSNTRLSTSNVSFSLKVSKPSSVHRDRI